MCSPAQPGTDNPSAPRQPNGLTNPAYPQASVAMYIPSRLRPTTNAHYKHPTTLAGPYPPIPSNPLLCPGRRTVPTHSLCMCVLTVPRSTHCMCNSCAMLCELPAHMCCRSTTGNRACSCSKRRTDGRTGRTLSPREWIACRRQAPRQQPRTHIHTMC